MATWCVLTRQSPETYRSLNRLEREVFVIEAMKLREKGW